MSPMVTDPESGKKKHECDGTCRRTCDHCLRTISVHETWRWGLQSIGELQGGGGLTCLTCGHQLFEQLHGGAPSKTEYDAEDLVDWEECEVCGGLYPWSEGAEICDPCLAEMYDAEH